MKKQQQQKKPYSLFLLSLDVGFVSKDISLLLLFTRSVMLISAGMQNCNSHVIGRVCPSFGVLTVTFTAQESMAVFV